MKLRDRLLHLPRLVGRSNTAEGMGTLGLSHLHADNSWIKDYWDWAEEQHSVYTLTHRHTHRYTQTYGRTNTLALTCVGGLVPWGYAKWAQ